MNIGNAKKNMLYKKENNNKYFDSNFDIQLNNDNNSQIIVANKIKNESLVLDVGCGAGNLGKILKQKKDCIMYGVEIDNDAIEIAKNYYEEIYNFPIDQESNPNYLKFLNSDIKFDYIVFADLLEHVLDAGAVIYKLSQKLKTDGSILVSLPNVAHMDVIIGLLDGKFNYNVTGLLDTTHLRFYTKNSFIEIIQNINDKYNINLCVNLIGKTFVKPEIDENILSLYEKVFGDELYIFQNIFEIKVGEMKDELDRIENFDKLNNALRNSTISLNNKYKNESLDKIIEDLEKYEYERNVYYKELMDLKQTRIYKIIKTITRK